MVRKQTYVIIGVVVLVTVLVWLASQALAAHIPESVRSFTTLVAAAVTATLLALPQLLQMLFQFLQFMSGVKDSKDLAQDLMPQSSVKGIPKNMLQQLPQRDYEFRGREEELAEVKRLLDPERRHAVITIDGVGGVGKTALALETCFYYLQHYNQLPKKARFEVIIWATAKQTVLTGSGISQRQQTLKTLANLLETIAITLDRKDILDAPVDQQYTMAQQALVDQRTLLVVDNLETVDDERVMNFIREVPGQTKVIVTTRHRIDTAVPIRLLGMKEADARKLIDDECAKRRVTLIDQDKERLIKRTGGVPIAIVWSIAQMHDSYKPEAVLTRLGNPKDDVAKFCFEQSALLLKNKPSYEVLLALSMFPEPANEEQLSRITGLQILDIEDAVRELEKLSLVNRKEGEFSLLALTKTYAAVELENHPYLNDKLKAAYIKPSGVQLISAELFGKIRTTLARAGLIDTNAHVRRAFADERLAKWYRNLPEADTTSRRADAIISYLTNQYDQQGKNALVIFLEVLSELIRPDSSDYLRIQEAIQEIKHKSQKV